MELLRQLIAIDIRFEPQFIELHKLIWNDLRDEVILYLFVCP